MVCYANRNDPHGSQAYNSHWIRIHKAHRQTPAMAAGLTDKLMEMKDIVALMDDAEMKATIKKRVGMLSVPQSN